MEDKFCHRYILPIEPRNSRLISVAFPNNNKMMAILTVLNLLISHRSTNQKLRRPKKRTNNIPIPRRRRKQSNIQLIIIAPSKITRSAKMRYRLLSFDEWNKLLLEVKETETSTFQKSTYLI